MAEVISPDTPVSKLECKVAFENLTDKEKLYAHYLSRASFEGGLIVLFQTSPESVPIFLLLQALFSGQPVQEFKSTCNCNDDEWKVRISVVKAKFTWLKFIVSDNKRIYYLCQLLSRTQEYNIIDHFSFI